MESQSELHNHVLVDRGTGLYTIVTLNEKDR